MWFPWWCKTASGTAVLYEASAERAAWCAARWRQAGSAIPGVDAGTDAAVCGEPVESSFPPLGFWL